MHESGGKQTDNLTDQAYWDAYWEGIVLPQQIVRGEASYYLNQILDVFDAYLGRGNGRCVLEIGGAPGQYLAYLARALGYEISCLDYSARGCESTRRNFALLGIEGAVYQKDLFSDISGLPLFDVVYSLGLIEHFADLTGIVGKHLQLLKPGGLLLLGCPNFTGVYYLLLKSLAPILLSRHNLDSMRLSQWREFEEAFRLEALFRGYVGGFEPNILDRCERNTARNRILLRVVRMLRTVQNNYPRRLGVLRHRNSRLTSGYVMGVYRKPT
jgi:2-polyprenyl-3-methyl-5-hydroxy-6-metoxy-1,4-benzoquinol methylase